MLFLDAGITNLQLEPCCQGINGTSCGDINSYGEPLYTLCPSPKRLFFWDNFHPSNVGWAGISNVALNLTWF